MLRRSYCIFVAQGIKRRFPDSLNSYSNAYLFSDCVGDAKMLRRSYLFEILCKRAQNRACSSSAECSQDYLKTMQEGRRSSPLGPHRSRTKVPRRGTFTAKQLVSSWLKFLCEALGRSSLRTKLRASSMHLHGLSNKIGSSTRSASSMHRGVRGDFSESVNSYFKSKIR